ncbi:MAG: acetolactate decarboxylase [Microthrixaceae bacterium]
MTAHGEIAHHGLLSSDDHHLATAASSRLLKVERTSLKEFSAEPPGQSGLVEQTSSIDALLHGAYAGDVSFGELARHGDFGLGTVQHLDGEMLCVDGDFLQVQSDGSVHSIDPEMLTPFAVMCRFEPEASYTLSSLLSWEDLQQQFQRISNDDFIQAFRIEAVLDWVSLRSVPRQYPPYPPLSEVTQMQTSWRVEHVSGTIIGFRFPAVLQGIEVAGIHLHFISEDRSVGGHVTDLLLKSGILSIQQLGELHVEVPAGVHVAAEDTSSETAAAIRAVEGQTSRQPKSN